MSVATEPKYGRLTIVSLEKLQSGQWKRTFAHCICDCGKTKTILLKSLRLKRRPTISCGCFHKEQLSARVRLHGMSATRAHDVWRKMIARCGRENTINFHNYGGRGISVCKEWKDSFLSFWNHISQFMPPGSTDIPDGLTVERKDNNGNYDPPNVRLATWPEQCRNKRVNRLLTFNGQTKCMKDWSDLLGLPYDMIRARLDRGMSVDKALSLPRGYRHS